MGIGMGGFLDGILAHQIFQLHSMLSARLPQDELVNVKTSMVWDGLFHLFTWITTIVSIVLFWKAKSDRNSLTGAGYSGAMIMGWGIFNLTEGLIDHHLIGIHHVVETRGLSVFDYLFLASGVILLIIGYSMVRADYKKSSHVAVA